VSIIATSNKLSDYSACINKSPYQVIPAHTTSS
jgi:hypothetical protein